MIRLNVEGGKLTIKTASERGQVNEALDIYMEGDEVNILFNANFLTDALSKMHYDALDVEMSGDLGHVCSSQRTTSAISICFCR